MTKITHKSIKTKMSKEICSLYPNFRYCSVFSEFSPHKSGKRFDFFVTLDYKGPYLGFEMKLTREDLMSDLKSGKWLGYLPYCNSFFFLIHESVKFKYSEIPECAGIKVFGSKIIKDKSRNAERRNLEYAASYSVLTGLCYRYDSLHRTNINHIIPAAKQKKGRRLR